MDIRSATRDKPNGLPIWQQSFTHDPNFAGVFYWSPEWYDGGLWDAFALFDSQAPPGPLLGPSRQNTTTNHLASPSIAPAVRQRTQDRIEYRVQAPAHVRGEEPQHEVAVFLQQQVLAPIAAIGLLAVQML